MIVNVIMLAMFVEAIIAALKPIWKGDGQKMSITEVVSIVVGVILAIAMKVDMFSYICDYSIWDAPGWVYYIFYAMTGVAIGRGPSFLHDLWKALIKWQEIDMSIPDDSDDDEDEKEEAEE